jgi:hypothetical protein
MSVYSSGFRAMVQPAKLLRVQPKFAANGDTNKAVRTVHPFDGIVESGGDAPKESNALKKAGWTLLGFLGITLVGGVLTSPIWAPIAGVATACRTNEPEGAIAKIFPTAGLGPVKGICPSAFVMDNGDIFTNDAPSWQTFHKKGHASSDGVVSHQDGVVGRLVGEEFFKGKLATDLIISQTDASKPSHFDELREKPAASKIVDDHGTVRQVGKWGYVTLTEGKTELIGAAKGKKLTDLPEAQQTEIKAAAAANAYLWG